MSDDPNALPDTVLNAFYGLLPIGVVLGALYGAGVLSGVALVWIVIGGTTVFVPWAVLQLDPRALDSHADSANQDDGPV